MEKFNNLLNREDYIKGVNEGKIGDFVRKGVKKLGEKVAKFFFVASRKIQNMIATFDSNGNVLPVVSPQSVADHFKGSKGVTVVGSKEFNKEIITIGGSGCETSIEKTDDSNRDWTPNGAEEYINWVNNEYKKTDYYKNLQTLKRMMSERLSESKDFSGLDVINEKNLTPEQTVRYDSKKEGSGTENFSTITSEEFKKRLNDRIDFWCVENEKNRRKIPEGYGNMLVFGAPGIGKSSIPNEVVREYNSIGKKENKDKITLISVNCSLLEPGEFLMPAFPKKKNILKYLQDNLDTLQINPKAKEKIKELDDDSDFAKALSASNQNTANDAPASWLPVFKRQPGSDNNRLNRYLNIAANGGMIGTGEYVTTVDDWGDEYTDEVYENTGSGGIILLDEFLRAKPSIFAQLMNFLLDRKFNGWELGSKWFIVACSNRPCDDAETAEGWESIGGAGRDRFCQIFNMDPNPEDWKKFMRDKGFDETLISFIFDESTKKHDEYFNWIRVVNRDEASSDSHKPITPRNWFRVHAALYNFYIDHEDEERFKNGYGITNMTVDEIKDTLKGIVDDDYLSDLTSWLHQNCVAVDADKILDDPDSVPMPMLNADFGEDKGSIKEAKTIGEKSKETNEENVINTLRRQLTTKWKVNKEKPTDEQLTNLIYWLGKNFKNRFNLVCGNLIYQLKNMIEDFGFWDYHKFGLTFWAAFPEEDSPELYNHEELNAVLRDKEHGKTKFFLDKDESIESVVKKIAKEKFPWRVSGDELIPITQTAPDMDEVKNMVEDTETKETETKETEE